MPKEKYMRYIVINGKTLHFKALGHSKTPPEYYHCNDLITGDTICLRINKQTQIWSFITEEVENKDVTVILKCIKHGSRFIGFGQPNEPTFGYVGKVSKKTEKSIKLEHPEIFI